MNAFYWWMTIKKWNGKSDDDFLKEAFEKKGKYCNGYYYKWLQTAMGREFTLPWIRIIRDESHGLCTSFLYRFLITFLWNFPSPSSIIKTRMDESNFGCPSITNNIAIYIYIFAVYIIHFRNLHRFLPFFKNSFSFLQVGILLK